MTEVEGWNWWVGHDDERYHTECETREEAIRIAREEQDGGHIVEAMKPANIRLSRYFDGFMFIENAEDSAFDDHGDPDGVIDVFPLTPEQCKDLQHAVMAAMDEWQDANGLVFKGFQFRLSRNHEYIPAAEESA